MIKDLIEKTEVDIIDLETEVEVAVEKDQNPEKDIIIINTHQDK
jgi:hypothetical protein